MELLHNFGETVRGLAFDSSDNLFVALTNSTVDMLSFNSGVVSVVKGPSFNLPGWLVFDHKGTLYVGNGAKIMKYHPPVST